jgi:hypothetical protein
MGFPDAASGALVLRPLSGERRTASARGAICANTSGATLSIGANERGRTNAAGSLLTLSLGEKWFVVGAPYFAEHHAK